MACIMMLPLRKNVQEPKNEAWKVTRCPVCGAECWASEHAQAIVEAHPGALAACTECALAGRGAPWVLKSTNIQVKVEERRYLMHEDLYRLCNQKQWYTMGDTEEYAALFAKLRDGHGVLAEMTTERLTEIAVDIAEHSEGGKAMIGYVLHELAKVCTHVFHVS